MRSSSATLRASAANVRLAEAYRETPQAGRTHALHATPITFGLKFAVWLAETQPQYRAAGVTQTAERTFVGSLVGAVDTHASFDELALALQTSVMAGLGLGVPAISWHLARDRFAELGARRPVVGTLAKIANEIILLRAQQDRRAQPSPQ